MPARRKLATAQPPRNDRSDRNDTAGSAGTVNQNLIARLPTPLIAQIDSMADEEHRSRSSMASILLREALESRTA